MPCQLGYKPRFCALRIFPFFGHTHTVKTAHWIAGRGTARTGNSGSQRNELSWTKLISDHTKRGHGRQVLAIYKEMLEQGVIPSTYTFVALLKAYSAVVDLEAGKKIHADLIESGNETNVFVANALVDMYAKCGSILDARQVFEKIPHRDLVSWTSMILGYAQMQMGEWALQLYARMQDEGFTPNNRTFVAALKACGSLATQEEAKEVDGQLIKPRSLEQGRAIHSQVVKSEFKSDIFVATALVALYVKCGSMIDASQVFEKMPHRDIVSWTTMIMGYTQMEKGESALQLYARMQNEGFMPDDRTLVAALKACSSLAAHEEAKEVNRELIKLNSLEKGRVIHSEVAKSGFETNVFVANSLVDMYAKCGSMVNAGQVFEKIIHRTAVSWNTMIVGYAHMEMGDSALQLYVRMQHEGFMPDDRTFVAALKACGSLAAHEEAKEVDGEFVKVRSLERGRVIHSQVAKSGYDSNKFVASTLVDMYAKCGSMTEARLVFENMPHRDVVSWTVMIIGYAQLEKGDLALQLYARMQHEGFKPNDRTFIAALKACGSLAAHEEAREIDGELVKVRSLEQGRAIHSQISKSGLQSNVFIGNTLVDMYAKCGSMVDAHQVFEKWPYHDVVSWTAMIYGYAQMEKGDLALQLYARMQHEGFTPNDRTFLAVLKACTSVAAHEVTNEVDSKSARKKCLEKVRTIHSQVVKSGFESNVFIANTLMNVYSKCGSMADACQVFENMRHRTVVSWNAMIMGYVQMEMGDLALQLYERMQHEGFRPDEYTFAAALKACSSLAAHPETKQVDCEHFKTKCLEKGRSIHSHIAKCGFQSNVFVADALVDMYVKRGSMVDACQVFEKMLHRTLVSWNSMIIGYTQMELGDSALQVYLRMQHEGVAPDDRTFVAVLKACSILAADEEAKEVNGAFIKIRCLEKGRAIHSQVSKNGFESNVYVANTLVDMYAKCGSMVDACQVFEKMMHRTVVSWNAMIIGYAQMQMGDLALQFYARMQHEGFVPDDRTFVAVLKACSTLAVQEEGKEVDVERMKIRCLEKGRAIHSEASKGGFESNTFVATALVAMYVKCGSMVDAREVFEKMTNHDAVSWTAMIVGYAQMEKGDLALQLYVRMQHAGFTPDDHTFVAALKACCSLAAYEEAKEIDGELIKVGSLEKGRAIHSQVAKNGFESNIFVTNTLIEMYVKCGSIIDACNVFEKMPNRDVVSWTVMILGYTQRERGDQALQLYARMQHEGFTPNAYTFVAALKACGSLAFLETGKKIHTEICKAGLEGEAFVITSLVDMYGKCGSMVDAQQLFDAFPVRDAVTWNALIAGYSGQGDWGCTLDFFERMQHENIQPDGITFVSLLTVCSHTGLVDKGQKYFQAMCSDHGIVPHSEHYSCMVDLLGRAGQIDEALTMVKKMPFEPVIVIWMAILSACRNWNNVEIGGHAFDCAMRLDGKRAAAYVMMTNIHFLSHVGEEC